MKKKLENRTQKLIKDAKRLIEKYEGWNNNYPPGPELYFYKKIMDKVEKNKVENLLENKKFIELLYTTLLSWDMNSRGAKMRYFDKSCKNIKEEKFYENITKKQNKKIFIKLSKSKSLVKLKENNLEETKNNLEKLFSGLNLMYTKSKIVSNSKVMHFILPKLMMPIDSGTLNYFYGNSSGSKNKFLEIFKCSWYIAKKTKLKKYLDRDENRTIPKIIDNIIREKTKRNNQ